VRPNVVSYPILKKILIIKGINSSENLKLIKIINLFKINMLKVRFNLHEHSDSDDDHDITTTQYSNIQCLFLTLAIGIYVIQILYRVNKLYSRNV
jgi:hypothetical protein